MNAQEMRNDRLYRSVIAAASCCSTKEFEDMCDDCVKKIDAKLATLDRALSDDKSAPPPVSLAAKIREARSLETRYAQTRRQTGDHPGLLETLKAKAHERAEALK